MESMLVSSTTVVISFGLWDQEPLTWLYVVLEHRTGSVIQRSMAAIARRCLSTSREIYVRLQH